MPRPLCPLIALLLAAGLVGCSPYVEDYRYRPRPAVAEIPGTQPSQPPPVVAFASVIGVRKADRDLPLSVEARLRLENDGPDPVFFDPQSLDLTNANLTRFRPPLAHPAEPITLPPGGAVTISAFFPFPPGHSYDNTDLGSLVLRWHLRIGGREVTQAVHFRHVYPAYYYQPYPYSYWGYGPYPYFYPYYYPYPWFGGVVIVHRW